MHTLINQGIAGFKGLFGGDSYSSMRFDRLPDRRPVCVRHQTARRKLFCGFHPGFCPRCLGFIRSRRMRAGGENEKNHGKKYCDMGILKKNRDRSNRTENSRYAQGTLSPQKEKPVHESQETDNTKTDTRIPQKRTS